VGLIQDLVGGLTLRGAGSQGYDRLKESLPTADIFRVNGAPAFNLILLVVAVVVAFVAYRESEKFRRSNGVTPWNWPSWLWAVVGFISLVLCAILITIAKRKTDPVGTLWEPSSPSDTGPVSPSRAFATSVAASGSVPFPTTSRPLQPPPAWHGDPSGRFASRYWDGLRWTEHVSDGNSTSVDPI
jgi:Protein of unknown function (DUF2510)